MDYLRRFWAALWLATAAVALFGPGAARARPGSDPGSRRRPSWPGAADLDPCGVVRVEQTIEVDAKVSRVNEVHIRLAVKGAVIFEDGADDFGRIVVVDILRESRTEDELREIVVRHDIHVTADGAAIFVLQVYTAPGWSFESLTIVGVTMTSFVVIVVVVTGAVIVSLRRRLHHYDHHHRQHHRPGRSTSDAGDVITAPPAATSSDATKASQESSLSCDLLRHSENMASAYCAQNLFASMTKLDDNNEVPPEAEEKEEEEEGEEEAEEDMEGSPTTTTTATGSRRSHIMHRVTLLVVCVGGGFVAASTGVAVCLGETRADVIIRLPPTGIMDIDLFFVESNRNEVVRERMNRGRHNIRTFDLSSVRPIDGTHCDVIAACGRQDASGNRTMVTCDSGGGGGGGDGGECVCARGFVWIGGQCLDRDECKSGTGVCPREAECRNTNGSFTCHCPPGHFYGGQSCQECTVVCPEETFETEPCSSTADTACRECDSCSGATYELTPCTPHRNRKCLHPAFPAFIASNESLREFLQGFLQPLQPNYKRKRLRVESHSKVFLENRHVTRNLETTYYVTDAKQSTDFFWFREPGIRINIGLQNIQLIPVFRDADHDSDNSFILSNPNSQGKDSFKDILRNHCRHPLPDRYSLTIEVAKDRTTEAEMTLCTEDEYSQGRCPDDVLVGDWFMRRSLNGPCHHVGSYPEAMEPAANSVVCTDGSDLLRELFNMTPSVVRPISFPTKSCKMAAAHCEDCLERNDCLLPDDYERACCRTDCHRVVECREALGHKCLEPRPQCAMGDAYRFTLLPVFVDPGTDFRCHVTLQRPEVLYQLWFYVSILGTDFETPQVRRTVRADDLEYLSGGQYQVEFLTVEHSAGIQLQDEFILTGRRGASGRWNHTLNSVHGGRNYPPPPPPTQSVDQGRFPVHSISSTILVTSTQFATPFGYSTSSWVRGNSCVKDIGRFRPVQKTHGGGQKVNVVTTLAGGQGHFEYWVKSVVNPPHLKFTIPANVSVLEWWFRDKNSGLDLDSLRSDLDLSKDKRSWIISLSGQMTDCPAFLSITINDRLECEELFSHDLLISCPPFFNLTFTVPTQGLLHQDKVFDIVFFDSKQEYRVFLTYLQQVNEKRVFHGSRLDRKLPDGSGSRTPDRGSGSRTGSDDDGGITEGLVFFGFVVSSSLAVVLFGVLVSLVIHLSSVFCAKQRAKKRYSNNSGVEGKGDDGGGDGGGFRAMTSLRRSAFVIYVIVRVVVTLLLTFTAFFALLALLLRRPMERIRIGANEAPLDLLGVDLAPVVESQALEQLEKQTETAGSIRVACSRYVDEVAAEVMRRVDWTNVIIGSDHSSMISARAKEAFETGAERTAKHLGVAWQRQVRAVENQVRPMVRRCRNGVAEAVGSRWFQFARSLFNATAQRWNDGGSSDDDDEEEEEDRIDLDLEFHLNGTNDTWNLMEFLQIGDDVERHHNTWKSFLERSEQTFRDVIGALNDTEVHRLTVPMATSFCPRSYENQRSRDAAAHSTRYFVSTAGIEPGWETKSSFSSSGAQRKASHSNDTTTEPEKNGTGSGALFLVDGWSFVHTVFFALDLVIVASRLTCLYVGIRRLNAGTVARRSSTCGLHHRHRHHRHHHHPASVYTTQERHHGRQPPPPPTDHDSACNNCAPTTDPHPPRIRNSAASTGGSSHHFPPIACPLGLTYYSATTTTTAAAANCSPLLPPKNGSSSCMTSAGEYCWERACAAEAMPKLVFASVFVVVAYVIIRWSTSCLLHSDFLLLATGYRKLVDAVEVDVRFLETDVERSADGVEREAVDDVHRQSVFELGNVEAVVKFYEAEFERALGVYRMDLCSIRTEHKTSSEVHRNTVCDIRNTSTRSSVLGSIPMPPCNIAPLRVLWHQGSTAVP